MAKYKIMTGEELGKCVYDMMKKNQAIDIAFWSDFEETTAESETDDINFSTAYGIKNISIFDDFNYQYPGLLAIGYWGGGSTQVHDCTIDFDQDEVVEFINDYITYWCSNSPVVVEISSVDELRLKA